MRVSFFKRTIFVLFVVLSVITAFALAGCEDKDGCNHVWNDGEITTAATCTQDGVKTFTCTLCGETHTEVVGSSGHVASETFVNTDPEGHYHVCLVCGEKTDDVQAHAFEDGEVIKQPSATEEGLQKIVCSVCGCESTKVLSPETHTHVFDREVADAKYLVSEATCIAKAVYYKSCACGEKGTETFESGEVAGHVFDQEVADQKYLVSEATCTAKAVYYKSCACGEKGTETFESGEVAAHVFDREIADPQYLVSEATCTAKAVYYKSCVCGAKGTETFESGEVAAHVFDQEVADQKYLVSEATCTAKAVYYKSCVCGAKGTETFESGEVAAHTLVKTDRVEPTCIENGTEAYWTCSECGKSFSDENGQNETSEPVVIPATGHTYGDWKKDATGHWYECSVCENKKDFAEHTPDKDAPTETEGVVCTVCGYEIQPAAGHEHSPSDVWSADDQYHWHACGGCSQQLDKAAHSGGTASCEAKAVCDVCGAEYGEYAAHTLVKTERVEATCANAGTEAYWTCSACDKLFLDENGTTEIGEPVVIPATGDHVYGADLVKDETGHWYECSVCHARFNESPHEWDGGVVTTKPTLTAEGEKTYTCACGETKVEKLPAQASFADDFTLEEGQPGPWSYGSVNYVWGAQEDFTFTQATSKNDGGDGWAAEGVEIKGGWINSNGMAAIAYTVDEAARVGVTLEFIGSQAETHLILRIGIKSSLGEIYFNPDFIDSGTNTISVTGSYNLAAGDTLYFIFSNENPDAYPSGGLSVTLVKEADSGHVLTKVDEVAPTCTTSGTAAYYTCSHCDKIFADANANREIDAPVTTDALGHDTDGVNWTAKGDVHYKACRRCDAHIDEAAHSGGTASCEAKAVCEVCDAEYGEYAAHTLVKTERVEATCANAGTEAYWTCSACGKLFSDENGTTEIGEPVEIPATGDHVYGADLVKDATGHWYECSVCGNKKDFAEHTPDKDAPTETEGVVCTVCDYEIQPATGHEHSPSDVWSADDQYHWHDCSGCSQQLDKAAHVFDREIADPQYLVSEATCTAKAVYYKSCVCGAKGTETFESGEVAAHVFDREIADPQYLVSEATCTAKAVYYKSCVCGETGTETFEYGDLAEHTLVGGHNADGHWQECTVCLQKFNESAHEWGGGVVMTKPTLTSEGEKTYTCACGETKVEKLAAQASFADDFTLEEGQPGPWSYGSVNYVWGAQEDFTFTQATSKNDGGDGWAAEGVEIKGGWINANNMMAVAYTVDSDVTVKVNLTFTGGTADTRLSLRTGVKNTDGVIYGNPAYFDGGKQSNVLNYETTLELKAGDTVYFILGNENGTNPAAYPNGELDIVLTQVIG